MQQCQPASSMQPCQPNWRAGRSRGRTLAFHAHGRRVQCHLCLTPGLLRVLPGLSLHSSSLLRTLPGLSLRSSSLLRTLPGLSLRSSSLLRSLSGSSRLGSTRLQGQQALPQRSDFRLHGAQSTAAAMQEQQEPSQSCQNRSRHQQKHRLSPPTHHPPTRPQHVKPRLANTHIPASVLLGDCSPHLSSKLALVCGCVVNTLQTRFLSTSLE
jgi:hypothetical protein